MQPALAGCTAKTPSGSAPGVLSTQLFWQPVSRAGACQLQAVCHVTSLLLLDALPLLMQALAAGTHTPSAACLHGVSSLQTIVIAVVFSCSMYARWMQHRLCPCKPTSVWLFSCLHGCALDMHRPCCMPDCKTATHSDVSCDSI